REEPRREDKGNGPGSQNPSERHGGGPSCPASAEGTEETMGTLAGGRTGRDGVEGGCPRGGMGSAETSRSNIGKSEPRDQTLFCATEIFSGADLSIRPYAQRMLDPSLRLAGADRLRRHPAASRSDGARGGGWLCLLLRLALPRGTHCERRAL